MKHLFRVPSRRWRRGHLQNLWHRRHRRGIKKRKIGVVTIAMFVRSITASVSTTMVVVASTSSSSSATATVFGRGVVVLVVAAVGLVGGGIEWK